MPMHMVSTAPNLLTLAIQLITTMLVNLIEEHGSL